MLRIFLMWSTYIKLKFSLFILQVPGERFGAGVHNIVYVATDRDGQSARCEFRIMVKGMHITIFFIIFHSII